jgi:hypothetical protein
MSRKSIELNDDNIELLASYGLTLTEIAVMCRCSHHTITKHHQEALNNGHAVCRSSLRRKQYELAMGLDKNGQQTEKPNPTMLIWLGKNLLGQSDVNTIKGDAANPLQINTDREVLIDKLIGDRAAPKPN